MIGGVFDSVSGAVFDLVTEVATDSGCAFTSNVVQLSLSIAQTELALWSSHM